jgi:RNA polymerase sigma factor (sigma-70 family)
MKPQELLPHLFRTEFTKITAVLAKHFGMANIQLAEDIASDTFLLAVETWSFKGIPENPTAWLYAVAKNKAKNSIHRQQIFDNKIAAKIQERPHEALVDIDLSERNITDSLLQMLFALCHPCIPVEAQIGLSLRILCGFGIDEIADAFLTNKEAINKRLFRAREKLRSEKVVMELPGNAEIDKRLATVLTTLYLLFNEGYYSESRDPVLRDDLCLEAMRLTFLLIENPQTNVPSVNALFSLMCFHASRFEARKAKNGGLVFYEDQDESLWNRELISRGAFFLHHATVGNNLTKYHLEASIAYWHTVKTDSEEKWRNILQLYDVLLQMEDSPLAALNRVYAYSKVNGESKAIPEAEKLRLNDNHYYFTLLGELYKDIDHHRAIDNFEKALLKARNKTDRQTLRHKIGQLSKQH